MKNNLLTVITDDIATIKRLAYMGELKSLKINWLKSILAWNVLYQGTFTYKP